MGLGHNDPWVGSMTFISIFCKNCHCIHILDVCSGETHGSRTTCLCTFQKKGKKAKITGWPTLKTCLLRHDLRHFYD